MCPGDQVSVTHGLDWCLGRCPLQGQLAHLAQGLWGTLTQLFKSFRAHFLGTPVFYLTLGRVVDAGFPGYSGGNEPSYS